MYYVQANNFCLLLPTNLQDEFIQRRQWLRGYYFYLLSCHFCRLVKPALVLIKPTLKINYILTKHFQSQGVILSFTKKLLDICTF